MNNLAQQLQKNQKVIDPTDLVADPAITGWIADLLLERLKGILTQVGEPGILILNLIHTAYVGSSSAVIVSLIQTNRDEHWQKAIVCKNTLDSHRTQLQRALKLHPYRMNVNALHSSKDRYLLLACDRESSEWHLLGDQILNRPERAIWELIRSVQRISLADIAGQLNIERKAAESYLQVFMDNYIVLIEKRDDQIEHCYPIHNHVSPEQTQ